MTASVSVIIPSYNYGRCLAEAVASVLAQNAEDTELLIFDDGSSDDSPVIGRRLAAENPSRVRYLEHPGQKNHGLAKTYREALRHCRGHFIAFLEADDVWTAGSLARRIRILERQPETALVHGGVSMAGDPVQIARFSAEYRWHDFPSRSTTDRPYEALPYLLRGNVTLTLSSIVARASALSDLDWNAPHDAWIDWWLLAQLSTRGKFHYDSHPAVRWRVHAESYNVRYRDSIDCAAEGRAYQEEILKLAGEHVSKMPLENRRRSLEKILAAEIHARKTRAGMWATIKKALPAPLKAALKKILFPAAACPEA